MYSNMLGKLKEFNVSDDTIGYLEYCLEEIAKQNITRFGPAIAAEIMDISKDEAESLLLRSAQVGAIKVYFEIECPEGDSDLYVSQLSDIDSYLQRQCRVCDTVYYPSADHIWLTFGIESKPHPKV